MKWLTAIKHVSEEVDPSEKADIPQKTEGAEVFQQQGTPTAKSPDLVVTELKTSQEGNHQQSVPGDPSEIEPSGNAVSEVEKPETASKAVQPSNEVSAPPINVSATEKKTEDAKTQVTQEQQIESDPRQKPSQKKHHHGIENAFKTLFKLLLVTGLTHLAWHGYISQFWYQLFGMHMNKVNQAYLTEARSYTEHLLEILTESKMVLSLLQSSSGGISFIVDVQLQVGETLSGLNDAVTFAWKISLASLSAVEFLSLSLDLSHYSMAPALTLCFILLSLSIVNSILFKGAGVFFHKLTNTFIFAVLLTHFIIPAAVFTSAVVSQDVFSRHRIEVLQSFSHFHSTLPTQEHGSGLKDQVHSGINYYKDNREKMHTHTHHLTRMTSRHIIINMVEYLILPLLMVYLLSRLRFLFVRTGLKS